MSSTDPSSSFSSIQKNQPDYQLRGKKKTTPSEIEVKKVEEAIKRIHRTVDWLENDDSLSIIRLKETPNRSVFALSKKDGEDIVGYATAKPVNDKTYYLSFIAVDTKKQRGGIGRNLLMRIIEKVKKKGGKVLKLDFEDTEKLNKFYLNERIPFKKTIEDYGSYGDGTPKKRVTYDLQTGPEKVC